MTVDQVGGSTMASHLRRAAIACAAVLGVVAALPVAPVSAQASVTITGKAQVGSMLKVKVSGGKATGITWQGCTVRPSSGSCGSGWRTLGSGARYTATRAGLFIRVQATVRSGGGSTRTVTSSAVGPVRKSGGGGASTVKVGLYMCPGGSAPATYVSILPGNKYLGPYTTKSSTPSRFRVVDGARYGGGVTLKLLDGPYANLPYLELEYYAAGTAPYGTVYDVPRLHIIDPQYDFTVGCSWLRDKPFLND